MNFTEKSKKEFMKAPSWNNECPSCTKKKFEKYIVKYLMELMGQQDLVQYLNEFFENKKIQFNINDNKEKTLNKIKNWAYFSRSKKSDGHEVMTPGERIREFVKFFDEILDSLKGSKSLRKNKMNLLFMMGIGIALIIFSLVLLF
ncbi:MAG: hypothetical protein ACTSVI_16110 [Promethearchaeota archaeon]